MAAPIRQFEPYRAVTKIRTYPEGASQTFVVGDVLILSGTSDKGNKVVIAGADAVAKIVGVAAQAASGTEGTSISVFSTEDNEFIGNIEGTTALDADMTGTAYGLVTSTGAVRVDTSDTTNTSVRITQLIDAVGTVSGRVAFVFTNLVSANAPYRAA